MLLLSINMDVRINSLLCRFLKQKGRWIYVQTITPHQIIININKEFNKMKMKFIKLSQNNRDLKIEIKIICQDQDIIINLQNSLQKVIKL
jgi:hypothetical protein